MQTILSAIFAQSLTGRIACVTSRQFAEVFSDRLAREQIHVWGWKDPRNSLTLPFWQELLPNLKTLIIVRNPLEVAYSMRERNGTSYAFGLRLWEIYNRRLIEAAGKHGLRRASCGDLNRCGGNEPH